MPSRLTVFATRPIQTFNAETLTNLAADPILGDIAEWWGLDYDETLAFFETTRVAALDLGGDDPAFRLTFDSEWRLDVEHFRASISMVEGQRNETLEELAEFEHEVPSRVLDTVERAVETLVLTVPVQTLDRYEYLLAFQLGFLFAEDGSGMLRDADRSWWDPGNRVTPILNTR